MSIDQEFVEFVIKSLVTKPEAVKIERRIDEKGVLLELTVDPEDLGRVIGKRGATAQSVRTLLRALGTKNDARYNLKIVDNGIGSEDRQASGQPSASSAPTGGAWGSDDANDTTDASDTVDDEGSAKPVVSDTEEDEEAEDEDNNEVKKDDESDSLAKTRRELRDLDDLDM